MTEKDFALLPVPVQQAIARGEVSEQEIEQRLRDATFGDLCPSCCARPINTSLGLCSVCMRKRSTQAHHALQAEIIAIRANNTAKKQTQRTREEYGIPLPRAGRTGSLKAAGRDV